MLISLNKDQTALRVTVLVGRCEIACVRAYLMPTVALIKKNVLLCPCDYTKHAS